jgi:hypothetical protein
MIALQCEFGCFRRWKLLDLISVQADVSALGKIDFGSLPCFFKSHLASNPPSFSLKVIDALLILGWAIFRDSIP